MTSVHDKHTCVNLHDVENVSLDKAGFQFEFPRCLLLKQFDTDLRTAINLEPSSQIKTFSPPI